MLLTSLPSPLWRNRQHTDPTPGTGGAGDSGAGGSSGGAEQTYTQADLDRLVGRARTEARRTAATELAAELGCTVEEAKAKIAAAVEAEERTKTEAQRAKDEADAAKAEAAQIKAEAEAERLTARVERRLAAAGVDSKALDRASRLLDVDPDADDATIDAEIATLREDVPGLFVAGDAPPPAPHIPPSGGRPTTPGGKTAEERAQDRFNKNKRRPGFNPPTAA